MRTLTKLRLARTASRVLLALRRLAGRGPRATVRRRKTRWQLDLREGIDLSIYLLGGFELRIARAWRRRIAPGSRVVDVGANVGAHALPLARHVGPQGEVVAIEPTDWAFAKLLRNLEENPDLARRVRPVQALLASGDETPSKDVEDAIYSSWPLAGEVLGGDEELHPLHGGRAMSVDGARVTTLDGVLEDLGIERVDFVKLDADGHEVSILEGARDLLHRARPEIGLEMAPCVFAPGELERLLEVLAEAKYRLTDLSARRTLPLDADALRRRIPHGVGENLLALPAEERELRPASARRRGLVQRVLLLAYAWVARSGLLGWRPVEAIFLRAYFIYKKRRERAEIKHLKELLPSASTVVDVGANCGFFTAEIADSSSVAQVLAIEPESTNYRRLQATLRRRGLGERVVAIQAAADAESGFAHLERNPLHHGDHKLATTEDGEKVESRTVDDLVAQHGKGEIGLIKIDVQGAELRVLAGAEDTVSRATPAIFLEVDEAGLKRYGAGLADVFDWVEGHGYAAFVLESTGSPEPRRRQVSTAEEVRRHIESTGEGYADLLLLSRALEDL